MLHGYRKFHCLRKRKRNLQRYCKRYCKKFDTLNYELERLLSKEKNKSIGLMKDKLGKKVIKEFVGLRTKL